MSTITLAEQLVEDVVAAVSSLQPFPVLPFMQRLYDKARQTPNAASFRDQLPLEAEYGPNDGLLLDGIDETDRLQKLALQSIVKVVSFLDDGTDKAGFRACVQGTLATQATNSDMLSLTSSLIAEHINWHLAGNSHKPVPPLRQLRETPGFADAFTRKLANSRFIMGEIYKDMAQRNHTFSMALLFITQYLHEGPGFTALSAPSFESSPARQVLSQWTSELATVPGINVNDLFAFITHIASGVLLPDTTVTPMKATVAFIGRDPSEDWTRRGAAFPVGALSRTILNSVFDPHLDALAQDDIVEYQTIAMANQAQWDGMGDRWLKAVGQVANFQTQSSRMENNDFGHGFAEGLSLGLAGGADVYVTTVTGQTLADWITSVRGSHPTLFTNNTPNTVQVEHHRTTPAGNCFVAGTKVATDKGDMSIEDITEGSRVLTDATTSRYGIASDEDVVTPPSEGKTMLVGFNNEGVFATPGHIFFTTTGPRAVEPELAMRENSFADVGRLCKGHALYRLSEDGKSYKVVPIESIQVEFVPATHVYGVHLREGDRSYHANGYHVAINYPEITIKSIARALSKVPRHQAVKMLRHIDELAPVFHKIGVPGVATLLRQELKDARRNKLTWPLTPTHKRHARRYQGLNFKNLKRTFILEARDSPLTDKRGPRGYKLPVLNIHEGVLHLDHDIVPRVAFDTKGSRVRWSRALGRGQGYEHGVLNFTTHGLLGHGAVYVSQDENPSDLPETCETIIPFVAQKATSTRLVRNRTTAGFVHATEFMTSTTAHPLVVANHIGGPAPSPIADPGTIDNEDFYDVVVDSVDWPADTAKTSATSPVSMGQVAMATYHSDGKGGLAIPVIVLPTLDKLLSDINKSRSAESQLEPLYQSTVLVNKTGTLTGTVTFKSASAVARLSDQAPKTENDQLPTKNLTFSNLDSTVTIPILFQSAQFAFSWDFNDISGAVYEFNPAMVGNTGQRYWFGTSPTTVQPTLMRSALAAKSADARTAAHTEATLVALPSGTHVGPVVAAVTAKPAPVTHVLMAAQPLTIQGISSIPGYSEDAVHKQSQTLLQNMMYYHMNESDRTTFLSYPKPKDLPIELADNLPADLKTWIHDTYAPAYISFMFSQVSLADSKGWRVNFDDVEKDKIWYWWSGSGTKCLSKAPQYQTLNELTSRAGMIALYGKTINPYLADGAKWAEQLFTSWTGKHALHALMQQPINDANVNLLNMYCNILHTLAPVPGALGGYADRLFNAVLAYAQSEQSDSTATFTDPTGEAGRQWLYDAMANLIQATLNNDPSLDSSVRKDLMDDLTELQKELGIDAQQEASVKTRIILAETNILIVNMAKWLTAIGTGISKLWGMSGFSLAGTIFQRAADASSKLSAKTVALMKGCGIVALTAVYAYAAFNSFVNWDKLSTTGRAQAILITMKMVTDVAGRSFAVWTDYKTARAAELEKAAADGTALDQGLRNEIRGPSGQNTNIELSRAEHGPESGISELVDDVSSVATVEGKVQSGDLIENPSFNEKVPLVPPRPSGPTAWSRFNTPANWMRTVGIAISVALVVVMSISLAQNWDDLNKTGKALGVIQVVTTALAIAVDVAVFAGEMLAMETAMFLTVLPIVGAVLAVVGLVVSILMMVLGTTEEKEPPPTPVETFIGSTAKPLVGTWDAMPKPALSYSMPTSVREGATTAFAVAAQNDSGADVARASIKVTVQGGSDPTCLFTNLTMTDLGIRPGGAAAASALTDGQAGALAVDAGPPATALTEAITQLRRSDTITSWDSVVQGVADPATNPLGGLTLLGTGGAKQGFIVSFCGVVNKAGSTVVQIVETLTNGDNCRAIFTITRQ
ncbi:hypothetical protein MFIFM68171_06643 [Madurella fahalii]|uniref:Uncharacterized protein n=1 Tax=Madurella fahalii TaxID=1157608 RepID=A0ABQ0GFB4_9PEZI